MSLHEQIEESNNGNWIPLGKTLVELKKNHPVDQWQQIVEKAGLAARRASEIVRAYSFVEANRPELLAQPNKVKGRPRTIGYLYVVKEKNNLDDVQFEKVIDGTISGKISHDRLSGRVRKGKEGKSTSVKLSRSTSVTSKEAMLGNIQSLRFLLDEVIDDEGTVEELRESIGKQCGELANRLGAVSNKEFYRKYKQTKEFSI